MRNEFNNQMLSLRNQSGSSVPGRHQHRTGGGAVRCSQAQCCPAPIWASEAIGNIFKKRSEILAIRKSVHKRHEELWVVKLLAVPYFV